MPVKYIWVAIIYILSLIATFTVGSKKPGKSLANILFYVMLAAGLVAAGSLIVFTLTASHAMGGGLAYWLFIFGGIIGGILLFLLAAFAAVYAAFTGRLF